MSDEEIAKEYVKKECCPTCDYKEGCSSVGGCYGFDCFLAGLKAGKPRWYKPSEKLPDQYDNVLNEDGYGVFYDGKCWRNNDAEQYICDEPKYWCEIPTFDKE